MDSERMVNYYKILFQKVSFDPNLLDKEFKKSLIHLNPDDREILANWVRKNFPGIINSTRNSNY